MMSRDFQNAHDALECGLVNRANVVASPQQRGFFVGFLAAAAGPWCGFLRRFPHHGHTLWTALVCDRVFVPLGLGGFSPAKWGKLEAAGIEPAFALESLRVTTGFEPRTHLVTVENGVERTAP